MDENENQVPSTVVEDSPSVKGALGNMTVDDIASKPWDEVRKKARLSRAEKRAAKGFVGSQSESDVTTNPSDDGEYTAENTQEGADAQATSQETPKQPKAKSEPEPTADERIKASEAAAHEATRKLQEYEATQRKNAEQAEIQRRQTEYVNTVNAIQARSDWSPAYKEQVVQAYQQQLLQSELDAYGQHVQTREQQLAQRVQEANLKEMRGKLPEYVSSIVDFVGKTVDVPTEELQAITNRPSFQSLLSQYQSPRDLAMIGEMLHVFADHQRQSLVEENERRRQEELGGYEASNTPVRITNAAGAGGGKSTVQRIEDIPSKDWGTYVKLLKSEGTPARALAAMKGKK